MKIKVKTGLNNMIKKIKKLHFIVLVILLLSFSLTGMNDHISIMSDNIILAAEDGSSDTTVDTTKSKGTNVVEGPEKEEVIYANMNGDGSVKAIYTVNIFDEIQASQLIDYGIYEKVINLTNMEELIVSTDSVTIPVTDGRFYYQGYLKSKELPWLVNITYMLDGVTVLSNELSGRSGHLEIHIHTSDNPAVNQVFFDNYMLQINLTLDTEQCSRIVADGAMLANAGSSKSINFTVMPGMTYEAVVSADVESFEMKGIQINAVPMSMQITIPDIQDMTADLVTLEDAIVELNEGAGQISSGILAMNDGSVLLKDGSDSFLVGMNQVAEQAPILSSGSKQIYESLQTIVTAFAGQDLSAGMASFGQLMDALNQSADGLTQMSEGLNLLGTNFNIGYSALKQAIEAMPVEILDVSSLSASKDPAVLQLLQVYQAQLTAIMTVQQTFAEIDPLFIAVQETLPNLEQQTSVMADSMNLMAESIEGMQQNDTASQLTTLIEGMTALETGYGSFQSGLDEYLLGISKLGAGYTVLSNGISDIATGIDAAADGAKEYADGVNVLQDQTTGMSQKIEDRIDQMISDYDKSDVVIPSFVSEQNKTVDSVQFSMSFPTIEIPKEEEVIIETEKTTLLERFLHLFGL